MTPNRFLKNHAPGGSSYTFLNIPTFSPSLWKITSSWFLFRSLLEEQEVVQTAHEGLRQQRSRWGRTWWAKRLVFSPKPGTIWSFSLEKILQNPQACGFLSKPSFFEARLTTCSTLRKSWVQGLAFFRSQGNDTCINSIGPGWDWATAHLPRQQTALTLLAQEPSLPLSHANQ